MCSEKVITTVPALHHQDSKPLRRKFSIRKQRGILKRKITWKWLCTTVWQWCPWSIKIRRMQQGERETNTLQPHTPAASLQRAVSADLQNIPHQDATREIADMGLWFLLCLKLFQKYFRNNITLLFPNPDFKWNHALQRLVDELFWSKRV